MLSIPANLPATQARAANDYGAKIVAEQPTRFGLLASLPLNEPDAALSEIDHALDDLHADGFALVSNYDGAYFGDPKFDPVFAEMDRRGATVFLHPVQPPGFEATAWPSGPGDRVPLRHRPNRGGRNLCPPVPGQQR